MGAIHHNSFTEELYKLCPKGLYLRDSAHSYSEDKTERIYRLFNKKHREMVSFRARALPGCCGVLVVYYLRPIRGKREGSIFNETLDLIIQAAGLAKFGNVMLSQTMNSPGHNLLVDRSRLLPQGNRYQFTNWKTENQISVWQLATVKPPEVEVDPDFEGE